MKFQLVNSKPRIFLSTSSPSTGLKVFLLGLVRTGSKRYLAFDHRDISVAEAHLIAVIDDGSIADSRSISQISSRHIGKGPDGRVAGAGGVAKERTAPGGGVEIARGVAKQRNNSAGGVEGARGVAKECIESGGGVADA